ncbi:MAG: ABC transporter ATP-binding protein [Nocardioidaceae bacterium]
MSDAPLLQVRGLVKTYPSPGGHPWRSQVVHAVSGVDLEVRRGENLALVGESGSGKTTLARCVLGLTRPTQGSINFGGRDISTSTSRQRAAFRRRVQPVFQDPFSSLDPRWTIGRSIREGLDSYRIGSPVERAVRVRELLDHVGLPARYADQRPNELSGGQRQRVGIAAALALDPDLLVADEPVSALDVSVQAQILNLLADLQRDLGLAILFVAHDLSVVQHISDRIAVMYLGRIVETGTTDTVFHDPQHPYTRALLSAIPYPDPARRPEHVPLQGDIPSPLAPPTGCHLHPRCPVAIALCSTVDPALTDLGADHRAACHVAAAAAGHPLPHSSTPSRQKEQPCPSRP